MNFKILVGLLFLPFICKADIVLSKTKQFLPEIKEPTLYQQIKGDEKPDSLLFTKAYLGYIDLKLSGKISEENSILSLVDFRLPNSKKRLWVIDLQSKTILFHTFLAHGENSGEEYATHFSNKVNSHKSSLGFYKTLETYQGKNGLSLRLQGLEKGFNDNAKKRYIVLHGAPYVCEAFLIKNKAMGNSEGCPAVPIELSQKIISRTKEGSCLFLFFPDSDYIRKSNYYYR